MIETRIEISEADIKDIKKRLGIFQDKTPTVLARAINRTVDNIKTNMKNEAEKRYHVTKQAIAKTLEPHKVNESTLDNGYVKSKGAVIPLIKFKVAPTHTVSYKDGKANPAVYMASVKKGSALKPLDGNPKSFIAVMKNKHKGVFTRTGRWETSYREHQKRTREYNRKRGERAHSSHNEIIQQNFGPSVPQMIGNKECMRDIKEAAQSTLRKRIDVEIENILRKG